MAATKKKKRKKKNCIRLIFHSDLNFVTVKQFFINFTQKKVKIKPNPPASPNKKKSSSILLFGENMAICIPIFQAKVTGG